VGNGEFVGNSNCVGFGWDSQKKRWRGAPVSVFNAGERKFKSLRSRKPRDSGYGEGEGKMVGADWPVMGKKLGEVKKNDS